MWRRKGSLGRVAEEKYEFWARLLIFLVSVLNSVMEPVSWLEAVYGLMPLIIVLAGDHGSVNNESVGGK